MILEIMAELTAEEGMSEDEKRPTYIFKDRVERILEAEVAYAAHLADEAAREAEAEARAEEDALPDNVRTLKAYRSRTARAGESDG